jgi:hypothetical protein
MKKGEGSGFDYGRVKDLNLVFGGGIILQTPTVTSPENLTIANWFEPPPETGQRLPGNQSSAVLGVICE